MTVCHYCLEDGPITRDHIVPRRLVRRLHLPGNHSFHAKNIVPACGTCNVEKSDLDSGCLCSLCESAWAAYWRLEAEYHVRPESEVVYSSGWAEDHPTASE